MHTRRSFLCHTSSIALGFSGLRRLSAGDAKSLEVRGYGPLIADPGKILDLPAGFSYDIIGRAGETMSDGLILPGSPDGMAAFPGKENEVILVRNHEINPGASSSTGPFGKGNKKMNLVGKDRFYDSGDKSPCLGGTSTLVYDTKAKTVVRQFLSLTGTLRNCAGGPTPWSSWITCEETVVGAGGNLVRDHGWCFDVPATDQPALADPVPLKAMGRFNHEAVAVDPETGDVFETEDRHEGLIYRFVPKVKGKLAEGGKLFALKVKGKPSLDTRNWSENTFSVGDSKEIEWIEMKDVESPRDDLRIRGFKDGAACFARGEGMWYSKGSIFIACTNGGIKQRGQIWKLTRNKIELYAEPNDADLVDNCDNLTVAPWGDLILCEDGKGDQFLDVITPNGKILKLAKNAKSSGEFAGVCFSPDGSTLFVNMQREGFTLAITGPWKKKA